MQRSFFESLKRIQALAEIGLEYSTSDYDTERYNEIQEICFEMLEQLTDVPIEKIKPIIQENFGYKTPKVDVRAVVFNPEGKILLIQEKGDNCWALPGGWADVGYSPKIVTEKECFEEANLKVRASHLLALMDKTAQKMPPQFEYVYKLFIWCEPLGTEVSPGSETLNAGWFDENEIPELSLPRNLKSHIEMMFEYYSGKRTSVYLD
ncbi:MAG TPA: NUDIX hydrolase [Prolixibacteraceae bacterium]|nr:NUDIX hydrolase [Prolixibacteraceae bacterium]HPR84683.1 NUDIX hydrolase [Prolixibacteraceae bacterium]